MIELAPLQTLYERSRGHELPLPPPLTHVYGRLQLRSNPKRPYIIGNFVSTLDGVVSLNVPGHESGGDISGFNPHDRMLMGLLRAIADVVIVGAGTLRAEPDHVWTAEYIFPAFADAYRQLRAALGKSEPPLNVVVSASGQIDTERRVFQSGEVPVLTVTTTTGARRIRKQSIPRWVQVRSAGESKSISVKSILSKVSRARPSEVILVEGGPQLMADFFAEKFLDEQFLTLAPQIAGRDDSAPRPGFVAGKTFAPQTPLWGTLVSVKRADSHLFLRYRFT